MILKSSQIKLLLKFAGIALAIVLVIFIAAPGYGEEALTGEAAGLAASLNESLLLTFVGIFLIGLALNLTPCVYPMLAITVSIFGQQSESRSGLVFLRALSYVLGISTMYSILGLFAALTGGLFGSILQSPVVLLLVSLLFFVLSLSMFGFYELQMPSSLLSRLGGQRSASLFGTWLSGLFVGIFAAPCVGPPVIGLLTLVGHRGEPLFGFLVFFVLSLGLGFPYLILGTFTGLLQKLPRSGAWMNWVKKLLGTVLVAVGCFYLSLAAEPSLTFILIPLTMSLGGIYLGFVDKTQTSSYLFTWFKRLTGAALIVGSALFYQAGHVPSINWDKYTGQPIESGPAAIYFSASWCIPCLELDRMTFTERTAIEAMGQLKRFKVDLSNYDSPESKAVREKYRIVGVPTIVFLDKNGQEVRQERVVGFVSAEELINRIDRVKTAGDAGNETVALIYAPEAAEEEPSEASLVADTTSIVPGSSFNLGVFFKMREGWHVYWLNPGDSGTEPQISWRLPESFSVGKPEWPAPQRFDKPPFATFGHEGELLLAHEVSVPANLEPGTVVKIGADIEWLVCDEICISQSASVEIELPVAQTASPSSADPLFANAKYLLPETSPDWKFSAIYDNRSAKLIIEPPASVSLQNADALTFFPAQQGVFRHGSIKTSIDEGTIRVDMQRTGLPPDERLRGVIVLNEVISDQPRSIIVDTEWHKK
ncbi:MAG: Cytochrome c-type biogenesis protein DsbD, protein-disulfide reductase [Candidatus Rifleibacterium amylolyticum]|nr:MAG: Cytochrome c-type biogenesis protein DsbD, protein-disulfide reductase [Candidatus Rifleibacterium amylolyticum]